MIKNLRDWCMVATLRLILLILLPFPFDLRVKLGGKMISILASNIPVARKRILRNLDLVMPQLTLEEKQQLVKSVTRNFGMNLIEFYNMRAFAKRQTSIVPIGDGVKLLEDLIAQGKAAIFVSGHFGNWEVFRAFMFSKGKPMASLYKSNSNRHYEHIFLNSLQHSGPAFQTGVRGMAGLIRHLRDGQMISLLHDQRVYGAPLIPFMGHDAHTSLATAEMALKYDIPIIPIYVTRIGQKSQFELMIDQPIEHNTPTEMSRSMNESLERQISKNPDQWYWFHERWLIYKH